MLYSRSVVFATQSPLLSVHWKNMHTGAPGPKPTGRTTVLGILEPGDLSGEDMYGGSQAEWVRSDMSEGWAMDRSVHEAFFYDHLSVLFTKPCCQFQIARGLTLKRLHLTEEKLSQIVFHSVLEGIDSQVGRGHGRESLHSTFCHHFRDTRGSSASK
ncbi:hypothetical protein PHLGIDRAFT_271168 [Phlebiopsis gigantea 11061_1 CR5-6]|uniref:Uncharacterized protein n=1 Tax=Phlebiopsis gigantea (strain 11061_1 CR5-6) TaxID=745531 RepID=A0A0C3PCQ8_PHLG1|nr:hypothetical protein PHLGIDRAFT_271168 [Phlebiopsis gigantea 11061_1 CR5-6]